MKDIDHMTNEEINKLIDLKLKKKGMFVTIDKNGIKVDSLTKELTKRGKK